MIRLSFHSIRHFLAVCIISCLASYAVQAEDGKRDLPTINLSMNSAVLFAIHQNPDIDIFWERYLQSKHFTDESRSDLMPQLSMNAEVGYEYNDPASGLTPANNDTNYAGSTGVTLEQLIFDGFGTQSEGLRRERLSDSAFWNAQAKVEEIVTETVETYLDIVGYQQELEIIDELLKDLATTLSYVTDQYDEGAADKVMLDYTKSRVSFNTTEKNRLQAQLKDAVSNLEFLTGRLAPGFKAYYPELLNPDKIDLQYYLDMMMKSNSQLVSNDYEIEAMRQQLEVEKASFFPEVNFVFNAEQRYNKGGRVGQEREASAVVRLDYDIFDGFKRQHANKRVKSQVTELEIRKAKTLKELIRQIKLEYNQIEASASSLELTEEEILSSTNLKALNEENFKLGNINIIELVESAERLNSAKIKRSGLRKDMYNSTYRLLMLSSIIDQNHFCQSC